MNTKVSITFISLIIAIFAFTLLFPGPVSAETVCYWDGEDCSLGCARMCTAQSAGCCECNRRWVCIYYVSYKFSTSVEDLLSDSGVSEEGIGEITEALGVGIEEEKLKAILSEHVEGDAQAVLEEIVQLAERENPIELPKPGLTPESPFYFLDRWGEAIREFFTFDPESKVKLQITLAAERIAEIQAMLDEKGVEARGLDVAQARLAGHAAKAAAIVSQEKQKGRDVSQLAGELVDSLYSQGRMVKQVFNKKEQELEAERARVFGLYLDDIVREDNELRAKHDSEMSRIRDLKARIAEKQNSIAAALDLQKANIKGILDEEKRREDEARDAAAAAQEARQEATERETQLQEKEREKAIERSVQSSPRPSSLACTAGWHEFLAGIDDQFALPTEPAIPSPGLQLFMGQSARNFDEAGIDKAFGHTFEDIAPSQAMGTIEEASLEFRVRLSHPHPYTERNDTVSLLFTGADGNPLVGGWSRHIGLYGGNPGIVGGSWSGNRTALVQLDLASLPNVDGSITNLISTLNAQDFLDFYIQDDTDIDYAKLRVRHSCLPPIDITEPIEPFCTEDLWKCSSWSACAPAGTQTRTCTLVTDCPNVETPKPAEEQTCKVPVIGIEQPLEPICTEDIWECGRWGECSAAGTQTRVCTLGQDCPFAETPKPTESQTCEPPPPACVQIGQACGAATLCCEGDCNAAGICAAAAPACAQSGQPCGGAVSCCGGLTCASSGAGYLACQEPPPSEPPDLEAEKFFNSALHFNSSGSFTIAVGNVGSGSAASPITVTDELPDGLTYQSFSSPYSSDWSCSASGQKVTCVYSGPDISPGGFLPTLIINVAVSSIDDFPAAGGDQLINCATVAHPSDKNSGNNQDCASAVVTSG